ncbi:MAG: GGDEF domain-containing protein [Pseudomonadota bacterium]|nr:GGDEF domain-containing protein [Pseudomonadota bacterium]
MRNLLDIKYSETAALLMLLLAFQMLSYIVWGFYSTSHPVYQHFVDADVFRWMLTPNICATLLAFGWIILCLIKRHQTDWQNVLMIGAVSIYVVTMVFAGYVSGLFAMSLGVVLAGTPFVGMIMLPARVVLSAVSLAAIVLSFLAYLTVKGDLPYAPLFQQQLLGQSSDYTAFYFVSQIYFISPFLISVIVLSNDFLKQWRSREAQIRHLSETDPLTQLYNRRTAQTYLAKLMAQSDGHPVAVILMDLDFFKKINDTHGHLVGDRVLKEVAAAVRGSLRKNDLIARFGGEEFLLILDGMTCQTAKKVAERCRRLVQATIVLDDMGQPIALSGSFGVSCLLSGEQASMDDLLCEADVALYQAKANGRNQVVGHLCPNERMGLTHPSVRRVSQLEIEI